ncbi:MAG: hypothetical protein ACTSU6_04395 [Candidatus Njordarchaeales archaeon]
MGKKNKDPILDFVSPLVKRLATDIDFSELDKREIDEIKRVEASNGSLVLIMSMWDGRGSKTWQVGAMSDIPASYESTVTEMLGAGEDEAYRAQIYKSDGTCYELTGEAVKVSYSLDELD